MTGLCRLRYYSFITVKYANFQKYNTMKSRKAQGALEYLMTYGWALLIIVIVGGALYALDVFNPASQTGLRVDGLANFQVIDAALDNAAFAIEVGSRAGKAITVTDIDFTITDMAACNNTADDSDITVPVSGSQDATINAAAAGGCTFTSGTRYDVTVTIDYTISGSGISHTDQGTVAINAE